VSETVGVLGQERERQEAWHVLGLPDPIQVLAEEGMTRRLLSDDGWRHPRRAQLQSYFDANPNVQPPEGW
jgi:hypothetical protein